MPNNIENQTEELRRRTERLREKYEKDRQEKLEILRKIQILARATQNNS